MPFFQRLTAEFQRSTLDSADNQTNTWHFEGDEGSFVDRDEYAATIAGEVGAFYQDIDSELGTLMFVNPLILRVYDLEDPEPRPPILEELVTLTLPSAGDPLPPEVTMVMSFQAERLAGVNQARRRGRLYLPTSRESLTVVSSGRVIWSAATINTVVAAASGILTTQPAGSAWSVYSPTTFAATGSLAQSFSAVFEGWVDNEPDTQRRRGADFGVKTPFGP